ncbi:DUF4451 domain-containing protein [Phanerochaete sordida]|uniref:DUF4451 domain-containing protein n=1 Tax=Phanerochaete sordida TaxID=48140 RepID=A0A9P3GFV1_9APHY|nr:DUF4451 domain-containing protein [Phanerochaete sordida]
MLSFPATPPARSQRLSLDSPFFQAPAFVPCDSPTPRRDCPYPDLTARPSYRTLTAADTLLHLASSPAPSPRISLYPSTSTSSNAHSQSTQSTFPPSPGPTTPSRSIMHFDRSKLDVLAHPFSSPHALFYSPRYLGPSDNSPFGAVSCSPVLHEDERREQERARVRERDARSRMLEPPAKRQRTEYTSAVAPRGSRVRTYRRLLDTTISHADFKLSNRYARTDHDDELTNSSLEPDTDLAFNTDSEPAAAASSSPAPSTELMYPSSPPRPCPSSQTSLSPLSDLSDTRDLTSSSSYSPTSTLEATDFQPRPSAFSARIWPGRGTSMSIGTAAVTGTGTPRRPRANASKATATTETAVSFPPLHLSPFRYVPKEAAGRGRHQDEALLQNEPTESADTECCQSPCAESRLLDEDEDVQFKPEDWMRSPPRTRARARTVPGPSSQSEVTVPIPETPPARLRFRKRRRAAITYNEDSDSEYSEFFEDAVREEQSRPSKRRPTEPRRVVRQATASRRSASVRLPSTPPRDATPEEEDEGEISDETTEFALRTLPSHVTKHARFPLFYRAFAVPSYGVELPSFEARPETAHALGGAVANAPRGPLDLYTPRWVRGKGGAKVGMCPVCIEPPERGGIGRKIWLYTKFSAYKCYHMQYAHGISSSGKPFSPPVAFKHLTRPACGRQEKARILQGRCHACSKWVNVEGVKDVEVKVPEIFWWKHASKCHDGSNIAGEGGCYVENDVWRAAVGHAQD